MFPAEAGFLDSILGSQVSAGITDFISSENSDQLIITDNSQTMALLQADDSTLTLQVKTGKENEDIEDGIEGNVNVNILSENALLPANDLMTDPDENELTGLYSDQISVYVVKSGDSVSIIADMYDVSINTILWANDMKKGDTIKEGDVLFILPISGVEHIITKGQTLNGIAASYKADVSDVARFNGITEETKLVVGEKIIIPGGELYNENSSITTKTSIPARTPNLINVTGYFINPVPQYSRRSQGLHGPGNRGIDLAAPTGTPILASANGTVLLARNGWNGAYGNMIIIIHSNGTKTLYAHLSKITTTTGAKVSQGALIGYVGSTGRSTGPHLHFEVFNAKNPGATTPMSFATQ